MLIYCRQIATNDCDENNVIFSSDSGTLLYYLVSGETYNGLDYSYGHLRDANENLVQNGDSLITNATQTQGGMFIENPLDTNKVFLFTILGPVQFVTEMHPQGLYYNIIDKI